MLTTTTSSTRRRRETHATDPQMLRAYRHSLQGLDGSLEGKTPAAVVARMGWARSVGGVASYLALFARAGIGRRAIDQAVAKLAIHELPAARGCTYVVPATDYAIALAAGADGSEAEMRTAAKLGVTDAEMAKLCRAVVKALEAGPLDPDGIRAATGNASRSLGAEGKKKGLTTTLPLALGRLQARGEIRRIPEDGRLDRQRYRYALWRPSPLETKPVSTDAAKDALAARFFRWIGPASMAELRWFTGLGAKAAKLVSETLALAPIHDGSELLLPADQREAFARFAAPKKPQYALLASLDPLFATRREVASLVDEQDRRRAAKLARLLGPESGFYDLPSHGIVDRGRLVGLWEYDVDSESIVYATFAPPERALLAVVAETERFIRDELGDARSMSLDSPKSRAGRVDILRKLA